MGSGQFRLPGFDCVTSAFDRTADRTERAIVLLLHRPHGLNSCRIPRYIRWSCVRSGLERLFVDPQAHPGALWDPVLRIGVKWKPFQRRITVSASLVGCMSDWVAIGVGSTAQPADPLGTCKEGPTLKWPMKLQSSLWCGLRHYRLIKTRPTSSIIHGWKSFHSRRILFSEDWLLRQRSSTYFETFP